ncbi:unnamed protein product, partial [Rotaria magnacalcarata]
MKSKNQDTFLIAHAQRMRKYRQRQKENNIELYKNKVSNQRREHRLCTRFNVLSENQMLRKIDSIIKTRISNKEQQRRHRLNETNEQRRLRLHRDRIYQSSKLQKQRLEHSDLNNSRDTQILSDVPNPVTTYKII